jgi:DNA repair protein RecN (Recombination protein N)
MLDELHARDVALIRDATIQPSAGLTVLTGETGAGKTALLSAIKLLVGERADAGSVREGADSLEVEGRFFERGGDPDGCVVRRRVSADGRGRVEIDGRMGSVRELASGVGRTVDLCGQHEHQRLLSVASHVEILDAWLGEEAAEALGAYQDALAAARAAADELEHVRELSRTGAEKLEEAEFTLRKIDEVAPKEGEYEELEEALPRAEHAEALVAAASGAHNLVAGDDGASDALSAAVRALRDASNYDAKLGTWADALESSLIDIEDVASSLRDYADGVEWDPESLEQMQQRLSRLEGLRRSFGPRMEDVFARREQAAAVVAASEGGDEAEKRAKRGARRRREEARPRRRRAGCRAREGRTAPLGRGQRPDVTPRDGLGVACCLADATAARPVGEHGAKPRGVSLPASRRPHRAAAQAHRLGRRGEPRDACLQGGPGRC